ncbi:S-layer homology domain-containing protein [Fusibacter paucivorans]|uniref:S-layer homology domain-containing protein n=1 Tax=Fusibacter paucivorans TaxID=76009 RepID=A0ABS5PQT9_9FIRM|nr:S-layer homology domain-containing protein [Fusibacter paucivorans]MBS7527292.1 S-layer homology domain-containing protein [Fusibacter paucivorans]
MKKIIILMILMLTIGGTLNYAEENMPSNWAQKSVETLQSYKLFRDESFDRYQEDITRKDFVYFAVRLYEIIKDQEIEVDPNIHFADTDDLYVLKSATIGLAGGVGNGMFAPDTTLTREQLAVLVIKTMRLAGVELEPSAIGSYAYSDEKVFSPWATQSIYLAKSNDVINGVGYNLFNPDGHATTEAAIVIVNKIIDIATDQRMIDLTHYYKSHIVNPASYNYAADTVLTDILKQYGGVYVLHSTGDGSSRVVYSHDNEVNYYEKGYTAQQYPDLTIAMGFKNEVFVTFYGMFDEGNAMMVDFLKYAFKDLDTDMDEAVQRALTDIEGTLVTNDEQGWSYYNYKDLNEKTITVGDIQVSYDDRGFNFVVNFTY